MNINGSYKLQCVENIYFCLESSERLFPFILALAKNTKLFLIRYIWHCLVLATHIMVFLVESFTNIQLHILFHAKRKKGNKTHIAFFSFSF